MITLKKTILAAFVVMLAVCVASCNSQQRELKEMIDQANDELPARFDFGVATSIECKDNMVEIHYTTDDNLFPIAVLKDKGDLIKRAWKMSYIDQSANNDQVLNLILASGYGLKAVFDGEESHAHFEVTLSNEELKQAAKQKMPISEQLALQLEITNASLPQQIDDVTTLAGTTLEGEFMVYNYEIDDSKLSIDDMIAQKANYEENIKRALTQEINDAQSAAGMFFKLVMRAGRGVRYHYSGKTSGKVMDVELNNTALRQLVNEK